jgi:hypothetical protein
MKIEMKFLALLSTDSKKHQTLMWTGRRTDLLLLLLLFLRRAGAVVLPTLCQYSNSALQVHMWCTTARQAGMTKKKRELLRGIRKSNIFLLYKAEGNQSGSSPDFSYANQVQ